MVIHDASDHGAGSTRVVDNTGAMATEVRAQADSSIKSFKTAKTAGSGDLRYLEMTQDIYPAGSGAGASDKLGHRGSGPESGAGHGPPNDYFDNSGGQPKSGDASSGNVMRYREDGYPIGGRPNYHDGWSETLKDATQWSDEMKRRRDSGKDPNDAKWTSQQDFAAGRMALQLQRRHDDPNREDLAWNGTHDERIAAANKTLKEWNDDMKVVGPTLNQKWEKDLVKKVQGELETEAAQEYWRKAHAR